jgi:hypothetical protein
MSSHKKGSYSLRKNSLNGIKRILTLSNAILNTKYFSQCIITSRTGCNSDKMKTNYHTVRTIPQSNIKMLEECQHDTDNTLVLVGFVLLDI